MENINVKASQEEIDKLENAGVLEINGVEYIRKDHVVHILEKWKQKVSDGEKQPDTESKCNKHIVSNNEVSVCPKCASKDVIWTVYCNDCHEAM
jgi:hypothetical protein